jgi:DNA-binding transcriptional MerR regulator
MPAGTLTVNQASEVTKWSPRMLRYIDEQELVSPPRSRSGYRLFGAAELQRLRTLRDLLEDRGLTLHDLAFARRLRDDDALREAVESWLETEAERPAHVSPTEWLDWEAERHALRWPRQLEEPETTTTETR